MIRHIAQVFLLLSIACLATMGGAFQTTPRAGAQTDANNFMILLDVSGSMNSPSATDPSQSKLEVAKAALSDAIDAIDNDFINVGLRTFSGCDARDTEVLVPVQSLDRTLLTDALSSVSARGSTNITRALETSVGDLPTAGQRTIVLISDGEARCGGDPCEAVERIITNGIQIRVDTIGFQTAGTPAEPQLQCIANASGGDAISVTSAESLFDAVDTIVAPAPSGTAVDLQSDLCTVCNAHGGDRDNDGICDEWETDGIKIGSEEPWMIPGADPDVPDIYVEVEAIDSFGVAAGTFDPTKQSFANAGFNLHIEYGEQNVLASAPGDQIFAPNDPAFEAAKSSGFGRFDDPAHVTDARRLVYRFALVNGDLGGRGRLGTAEMGGNDFSIDAVETEAVESLFAADSSRVLNGLFMHELGHTLGLLHGGDDATVFSPNYPSIMNYMFNIPGLDSDDHAVADFPLDFSHGNLSTLNENSLFEFLGLGPNVPPAGMLINFRNSEGAWIRNYRVFPNGGVDWNGNGRIEDTPVVVQADLNLASPGSRSTSFNGGEYVPGLTPDGTDFRAVERVPQGLHEDFDDWSSLRLNFRCSAGFLNNQMALIADLDDDRGTRAIPSTEPIGCIEGEPLDTDGDDRIDTCGALVPAPLPTPTFAVPLPTPTFTALPQPTITVHPPDPTGVYGFGAPAPSLEVPLSNASPPLALPEVTSFDQHDSTPTTQQNTDNKPGDFANESETSNSRPTTIAVTGSASHEVAAFGAALIGSGFYLLGLRRRVCIST